MKKSYITHIISYSLLTIVTSTMGMDLSDDLPKATVYFQHGDSFVDALTYQPAKIDPQQRHGYCYFGNEGKKHFIQPTHYSRDIAAGEPIKITPLTPELLQIPTDFRHFGKAIISVAGKNFLLKSSVKKNIEKPVIAQGRYNTIPTAFYQQKDSEGIYQILSANKTSSSQTNTIADQKSLSGIILGYFDQTCYMKVTDNNTPKVIALPMESDIYKSVAAAVAEDKSTYVQYKSSIEETTDLTTISIVKAFEQQDTDNQPLMPISCNIHESINKSTNSTIVYEAKAKIVYNEDKKEFIKLTFNVAGIKYTRFTSYSYNFGSSQQFLINIDDIHQGAYVEFTMPTDTKKLIPLLNRILNKRNKKQLQDTEKPFEKSMREGFNTKKDGTLVATTWQKHLENPNLFLPLYDGTITQLDNKMCKVTIQQDQEPVSLILQNAYTSSILNGTQGKPVYLELIGKHSATVCIIKVKEEKKEDTQSTIKNGINEVITSFSFNNPRATAPSLATQYWYSLNGLLRQKGHYVAGGFAALFAGFVAYWYYTTK